LGHMPSSSEKQLEVILCALTEGAVAPRSTYQRGNVRRAKWKAHGWEGIARSNLRPKTEGRTPKRG